MSIDWSRIFDELKEQKVSMRQASADLDIPLTTLSNAKAGNDIGSSRGIRLISYWARNTNQAITDYPKINQ